MFNKSLSSVTLPAGTTLLGYELKQAVAQTSSAFVYEAYHSLLGTECLLYEFYVPEHVQRDAATGAWQIVPGHEAAAAQALNNFVEELRKLSSLSHPNILPVVNAVVQEELGIYCGIVPSLTPCPKPANADALKKLLVRSIDAISYLQKMGHAPQCVTQHSLGSVDGTVRLNVFDNLMSQGQMPQTLYPGYAPIEYVQPGSATVGASSVLYSLAAAVYTLLTGQVPVAAAQRIAKVDPYQSLSIRPELTKLYPEALLSTIDKALSLWPEDRWVSGVAWQQAIQEACKVKTTPVVPVASVVPVSNAAPMVPNPAVPIGQSIVDKLRGPIKPQTSNEKNGEEKKSQPAPVADSKADEQTLKDAYAAIKRKDVAALKKVLDSGVNVNATIEAEYLLMSVKSTLLYEAVGRGGVEIIKLLFNYGANANVKNPGFGDYPLHKAVDMKNVEVAKLLLAHGAHENVLDSQGRTPQKIAAWGIWKKIKNS